MKMFAEERRAAILAKIKSCSPIYVTDLVQEFGVSEATVRRDLAVLERRNLIKRTHGGAIPPNYGMEPPFRKKEIRHLDLKAMCNGLKTSSASKLPQNAPNSSSLKICLSPHVL